MTPPIRVLIADDHPTVIDSIGRAFDAEPNIEVAATARSGPDGALAIDTTKLDVVLCDVQMGGDAEGLRLLERYGGRGRPAFLMLSAFDYPTLFRAAFDRGAQGYVLKTSELGEVVDAVRAVARGGTAFSASSMRLIRAALRRPSNRELEVLDLVVAGAGNEEIATRLFLSVKTVESHIRRLFNRYGLMNRTELAVLALREGWVDGAVRAMNSGRPPHVPSACASTHRGVTAVLVGAAGQSRPWGGRRGTKGLPTGVSSAAVHRASPR